MAKKQPEMEFQPGMKVRVLKEFTWSSSTETVVVEIVEVSHAHLKVRGPGFDYVWIQKARVVGAP